MGYADPRTNFGFKPILSSTRSQPILRNFPNGVTPENVDSRR